MGSHAKIACLPARNARLEFGAAEMTCIERGDGGKRAIFLVFMRRPGATASSPETTTDTEQRKGK